MRFSLPEVEKHSTLNSLLFGRGKRLNIQHSSYCERKKTQQSTVFFLEEEGRGKVSLLWTVRMIHDAHACCFLALNPFSLTQKRGMSPQQAISIA